MMSEVCACRLQDNVGILPSPGMGLEHAGSSLIPAKRSNLKLARNINMWAPSITDQAALGRRILRLPQGLPAKRSFVNAPKRDTTRARTCCIGLPRGLWDRIILLMFTCCLFIFLHALFGFGGEDEALHASSVHPRAPLFTSPPWSRGSAASSKDQKIRTQATTRVMMQMDRHGNSEFLPSTASALISTPKIPQDAFPDPTSALVRTEHARALGGGSHSMTTKVKTSEDILFTPRGNSYDSFRLEFEDPAKGGENHGLYPVAAPPKTVQTGARRRRFGRCLPGEACR